MVALLGTLFFAAPAGAQAPSSDEAARQHFESGRAYFDRARYTDAIREFEEAYRLSGRAGLLLNISRSHEANGDPQNAIVGLERWLESADAGDPSRPEVEARLSRLRLTVEARAAQAEAAPEAEPTTETTPAVASSDERGPTRGRSPAGLIVAGAGAAAAAVGVTFLALGLRDANTVESPPPGSSWSDSADEYDRAPRRMGVGYALIGVGVAATIGGVILRLTSGSDEEPAVALRILPAAVSLEGSF